MTIKLQSTPVLVIGAGIMGAGIAQIAAQAGHNVLLFDAREGAARDALAKLALTLASLVSKGKLGEDQAQRTLAQIEPLSALEDAANAGLVVEAIVENLDAKHALFKQIESIVGAQCVLATNTSSISVTRLAAVTDRPGKFMGMHFMNPVPMMGLVELIRGIATEEETFRTVREVVVRLDKKPVNAEDFPAFIVNRILLPMINEAVYALYEGVGTVEAIDTAMRLGANHRMGPLQLADFIGLDTCLAVMQVLYEGLADSKYRPCPLLVKYVEAGWLGRKVKRGFYDYAGERPVPTR